MTELFHPLVQGWFAERFGEPTEPQRLGWPVIASEQHALIAAPTGSGKTLAAFLVCLDRLVRDWFDGHLENNLQVVYVSPLKALSNDIERNLQQPLAEISALAVSAGRGLPPIRTALRTGDTPASERQAMLRRPPHLLVTTPESLYLLLTSAKSRELLRTVKTVIVDEIHALARDKRGSHLALSLERLAALCPQPPVRIGLSATQRPIDDMARFLVGTSDAPCTVIDIGHVRELDLAIEVPPSELSAVCSHEQWAEIYQRLTDLITVHRSTLVFVNTRRLAERVAHHLRERLGEEAVASHHGSLSRALRLSAEQRLKAGQLKAIVATASLEMGIDIGYLDLACQLGSPRSIATFLQRVGRSGHTLGAIPKGRLFPLTRDELLECMALVRAVRETRLDSIEIPQAPLDILAQQLVAAVACEPTREEELYELCRRAWPYRNLTRQDFDAIVTMLSEGIVAGTRRGRYLHRDRIGGRLRATRGARLAALTSGGAIPETAEYRVITEESETLVGTVDEDFAIESMAGDVFLLGNTSWRVRAVRGGEVVVQDAQGAPPTIPFWFGEAPGRTEELSQEVSTLRHDMALGLAARDKTLAWLETQCGATHWAAQQAVQYVEAQVAAMGVVPTQRQIVLERFFDESGGMQVVIHAPLGARINRAWGLALRKRFCRGFDFELQAAATDNGIVLSLSPQHSVAPEDLARMLGPHNGQALLEQALLAAPLFFARWRWNVTRALAVLRQQNGSKVPPYLQRFRADDLLAAAFPQIVGCGENHQGDIPIPDHPLVRQTIHDCLHEAMDLNRWLALLGDIQRHDIALHGCTTREPSPFSHELLNANPYAFLDGAPLEERRTRAVHMRRNLDPEQFRDLSKLDPQAVAHVRDQAWPLVRGADELHDALMNLVVITSEEGEAWRDWFAELVHGGRAAEVTVNGAAAPSGKRTFWIAAERWPVIRAAYDEANASPRLQLPEELDGDWTCTDARVELVRGRSVLSGPVTAAELADLVGLDEALVRAALEALEGRGELLSGKFTRADGPTEWCQRQLLARISRLTLDGLRRQIQPVEPADFMRYLAQLHHLAGASACSGPQGVRQVITQLQGFPLASGAWEHSVLAPRVADYDPKWLDQLFLSGEVMWGRLRPPQTPEHNKRSAAAMARHIPIALVLREALPWLLPPDRADAKRLVRGVGADILEVLEQRGALFFQEITALTRLLPSQL
jgi:ATP-dependent Lhr-like helicase